MYFVIAFPLAILGNPSKAGYPYWRHANSAELVQMLHNVAPGESLHCLLEGISIQKYSISENFHQKPLKLEMDSSKLSTGQNRVNSC